jgi:2-dehydropantoate 2-reductase
MKIAVVGCGAMGGLFAAHLAEAQADVWAIDIWDAHVAAIAADGLAVQRAGTVRSVALRATTDPTAPGVADAVLIFVKYRHTGTAAAAARPLIGPDTLLVTVQNGLGNVEIIRGLYPDNPLLFGFTPLTSAVQRPGAIAAGGAGPTCLWPADGQVTPAMQAFCALLAQGGIAAALTPDIQTEIWKKLVVNCCSNPVCALTGLTVGAACDHPDYRALMDGVLGEIVALAQASGIPLDAATAHAYFAKVAAAARAHHPSMVADFRARRPTEIDALNGAILRLSAAHGLPAPFNQALVSLVHMTEAGWQAA